MFIHDDKFRSRPVTYFLYYYFPGKLVFHSSYIKSYGRRTSQGLTKLTRLTIEATEVSTVYKLVNLGLKPHEKNQN